MSNMVLNKPKRISSATTTPVDHGYAWLVLATCFLLRFLADGIWTCQGILMLQWEKRFNISSSQSAWIGSSFSSCAYLISPVTSALGNRLTHRVVIIGGGVVISGCVFALSLTSELWHVYLIVPLLGISVGIVFQPSCSFFALYFDKHYAIANGLCSSASGLSLFVFPPLFEVLITYFGFEGALRIMSAMLANICVGGYLLRSPPTLELSKQHNKTLTQETDAAPVNTRSSECILTSVIVKDFDLALFRNVRFIFQSIICGFLWGAIYAVLVYIIPYSISIGIPDIEASFIMSTVGISSLTARLFPVGYFVDKKMVSASTLAGIAYLTVGCVTILMPFLTEFTGLLVMAAVFGIGLGTCGTLCVVIASYAAGSVQKASGSIAWMFLMMGIGMLTCISGCGRLYDKTGTFHVPLILYGVMILIMAVIVLADPLLKCWQLRLEEHKEKMTRNLSHTTHVYSSLTDTDKSTPV